MRKIFLIVLVVVVLGGALALYARFRRKAQVAPPPAVEEHITAVTAGPSLIQSVTTNLVVDGNDLYYYDVTNDSLVRFNLETSRQEMLEWNLVAISSVFWSPNKAYALLNNLNTGPVRIESEFVVEDRPPDAENWWLVKLTDSEKILLEPSEVTRARWFNNNAVIVATISNGKTTFDERGLDGKLTSAIVTIPTAANGFEVGHQSILAWVTGWETTTIYLVDIAKKQTRQLTGTGSVERVLMSPDGTRAIMQATAGAERRLFLVDLAAPKLTKVSQTFDLQLASWSGSDQVLFIENGAVVEYDPASDTISQTGLTVNTSETIREIVASESALFYVTDSGIYSLDI